jgi:hypothetical protein
MDFAKHLREIIFRLDVVIERSDADAAGFGQLLGRRLHESLFEEKAGCYLGNVPPLGNSASFPSVLPGVVFGSAIYLCH